MLKLGSSFRTGLLLGTVLAAAPVAFAAEPAATDAAATLLPTGLAITPTILAGAVQQTLNPGLAAYPNFVAGEAVQARLSPDGSLLAIICAGQNSLDNASGNTDTANSTQYIFLYNVAGTNKTHPVLAQVIKQANAHVGLVWAPNGKTLYAAGGNDDAVYAYTNATGAFALAAKIALNHNKQGIGLAVQPNASGLASRPTARPSWSPTTTTTRSASSTRRATPSATSTTCGPTSRATRARAASLAASTRSRCW